MSTKLPGLGLKILLPKTKNKIGSWFPIPNGGGGGGATARLPFSPGQQVLTFSLTVSGT